MSKKGKNSGDQDLGTSEESIYSSEKSSAFGSESSDSKEITDGKLFNDPAKTGSDNLDSQNTYEEGNRRPATGVAHNVVRDQTSSPRLDPNNPDPNFPGENFPATISDYGYSTKEGGRNKDAGREVQSNTMSNRDTRAGRTDGSGFDTPGGVHDSGVADRLRQGRDFAANPAEAAGGGPSPQPDSFKGALMGVNTLIEEFAGRFSSGGAAGLAEIRQLQKQIMGMKSGDQLCPKCGQPLSDKARMNPTV